ncbi:CRISPR-associated protein Cas4 [Candidatus Viridilinea mediisalina]|uniref:CRISPR-associated exonuclease Cas4 n=1 Tax=Candidatus Viridilinea mediisalina TaxID=2024553 RepID=A0A2A6RNM4_9CHLR|nr:CRISPR-associated protein Cas4 [Candidatus Viridilinea mediisalina]PDW04662.1 CRISPR-associated protein Cas4 [Candidatus Viridilinea mediisalina]
MTPTTIEVTDLKQWRYCPRIVWYRYCLPAVRPVTDLMEHGREAHEREEGREERRSLRPYGLKEGERHFDVRIYSPELGLRGRVDLAIITPQRNHPQAEVVVVEYKDSEQRPGPHFKLQLTAYALMLEAMWRLPVRSGWFYLIPLRRAERIAISPTLRRQVTESVATIQQAISNETMPAPPATRRICVDCEFRRFCNDVV